MNGDEGLVSWTDAEENKLRQEVSDFVLDKITDAKHLDARAVLFEAYLGVMWLAAEISPAVYRDTLKRVRDMHEVCVNKYKKQIAQVKQELAEEGTDASNELDI